MWIEIKLSLGTVSKAVSRPARALWIEISCPGTMTAWTSVEAREGLVD